MALQITSASVEDAPLVFDIMQQAFAEYLGVLDPPSGVHAETVDDVIHALSEGGAVLAWIGDKPVGTARYAFHQESCYVGRVSVLPAYRGQGIASAMMERIEAIARAHGSAYLEIGVRMVLESNIHLYERLGYAVTEVFEHPKGGGMVATMVKRL
jgi:ribosomal protein S18 acetylase RimI-like enzyme